METNQDFGACMRRLAIAPPGKQAAALKVMLEVLTGKQPDQLLYTGAEACRMLSISIPTLFRLRKADKIKPVILRGRPRYRRQDLEMLALGETKEVQESVAI